MRQKLVKIFGEKDESGINEFLKTHDVADSGIHMIAGAFMKAGYVYIFYWGDRDSEGMSEIDAIAMLDENLRSTQKEKISLMVQMEDVESLPDVGSKDKRLRKSEAHLEQERQMEFLEKKIKRLRSLIAMFQTGSASV